MLSHDDSPIDVRLMSQGLSFLLVDSVNSYIHGQNSNIYSSLMSFSSPQFDVACEPKDSSSGTKREGKEVGMARSTGFQNQYPGIGPPKNRRTQNRILNGANGRLVSACVKEISQFSSVHGRMWQKWI